ncbi:MAG: hypothetical protein JSU86_20330 [Phycisphaerales bacterium]|nr:MAG: hypothetical protein JSU86_20330 [Phycisphaerales bacterium]
MVPSAGVRLLRAVGLTNLNLDEVRRYTAIHRQRKHRRALAGTGQEKLSREGEDEMIRVERGGFGTVAFWARYRGEIIIAISVAGASFLGTTIVTVLVERRDPLLIAIVAMGFVVSTLLLALLFNLKRIVDSRFRRINDIIVDQFGFSWRESQYLQRLNHYRIEKEFLARAFVDLVLPELADRARKQHPQLTRLNLILDSGTTIARVFPRLLLRGVRGFPADKLRVYTNNLAGIAEIHRIHDVRDAVLSERHFVLVAGQPLSTHRATTGQAAQAFLKTIWDEQAQCSGTTVTIGVLAANWFLGGLGLDQLSFCARGEGHFSFEEKVFEHSNYVVFVTPLGKILRIDDETQLNKTSLIPGDDYRAYPIPESRKNSTYLLTSFRPDKTLSPLGNHSRHLDNIRKQELAKNYTFWEPVTVYDPSGTEADVRGTELPHAYARQHLEQIYL